MSRSIRSVGKLRLFVVLVTFVCAAIGVNVAQDSKTSKASTSKPFIETAALPLMFERNIGQPGASGDFSAQADGYKLHLDSGEMRLRVRAKDGSLDQLKISFAGANRKAAGVALEHLPTLTNYLIGNDRSKWRTGVMNYARVRYADIYPGVDVLFYGNSGMLEHDFVLAPGADPANIVLEIEGANSLILNDAGDVVINTSHGGEFRLRKAELYQMSGTRRIAVHSDYQLLAGNRIAFKMAKYDHNRELTIDPVLQFGTYAAGIADTTAAAVVTDGTTGDAYVTGNVASDFDNGRGYTGHEKNSLNSGGLGAGNQNIYIAKLSAADNGSKFNWVSYIGGSLIDTATAIAFNGTSVAVAGTTTSTDFPLSATYFSNANSEKLAGFAVKIDATTGGNVGNGGTYYGTYVTPSTQDGTAITRINAVAIGPALIYVAGGTQDSNFATQITDCGSFSPSPTAGATYNALLVALDPNQTGTTGARFLTVFNGNGGDSNTNPYVTQVNGMALDATTGNVYVAGTTNIDFPTDSSTQGTLVDTVIETTGNLDKTAAFVAKLLPAAINPTACPNNAGGGSFPGQSVLNARVYHDSTNHSIDTGNVIALNSGPTELYLGGSSTSGTTVDNATTPTPVTAHATNTTPNADGLIIKIDPTFPVLASHTNGEAQAFTYLGGTGADHVDSISVSSSGPVFVAGDTASLVSGGSNVTFPTQNAWAVPDSAIFGVAGKSSTGFIQELSASLALQYSVLIGGTSTGADSISGISALPSAGGNDLAIVAGTFASSTSEPSTSASAFQTSGTSGKNSAFFARVEYSATAAGVNTFAAGAFNANVTYGSQQKYTFTVTTTSNDSVLEIPAVAGLSNFSIDASSTALTPSNCTSGAGGITCIVPSSANGNIIVDGTVNVSVGTITVAATLADANNNSAGPITESSSAGKAALTITANDQTKVYGSVFTFAGTEFTTSGLVNGDTVTSVTLTSSGAAGTATVAGSPYSITPSAAVGTGLANYTISYANAPTGFTVTPAPLTITAKNQTKVYGSVFTFAGTEFTTTGTLFNGDAVTSVTLTSGGAAGTATVAGSPYTITPSAAVGTGLGNYTITYANASTGFTVTPAPLTITANSGQTKVYGQSDPTFTFASSGFQNSDTAASVLTGALARTAGENVSGNPYAINQGTLASNSNYTISFTGANFNITPAPLTITANSGQTKVYGQADPAFTFASSGFQFSDTAGSVLTGALARAAGENVSGNPYAISQGTLVSNSNYTISFTGANFNITPAPLTITANSGQTKVYGQADPAFTFASSGFKFTDTAASVLTGALARAAGENVAGNPYTINQGTLAANSNYTIGFTSANFNITPAPLTITANPQTKVYGQADPTLSFNSSGFQFTDTAATVLTGSLTRAAGETVPGSPYSINQGTLAANSNYTVGFTGSNLTITQRPLNVTATAHSADKVYDATQTAAVAFTDDAINGDIVNVTSTNLFVDRNVGTNKTINISGMSIVAGGPAANYMLGTTPSSTIANISQRALTVTAAAITKTYDGTASSLTTTPTITSGALQGSDAANFTQVYSDKNAGSGKTLTPSGTVNDGNSGGNYSYTFVAQNTGTINKLALTVTAVSFSKTYDGTAATTASPTLSSALGALAPGDSSGFIEAFTSKDAGTGKALVPSGVANDGNSGNNYSYTYINNNAGIITAFGITGNVTASNKQYDGGTTATLTACTPNNVFAIDSGLVTCSAATAAFSDKNVAVGKTVTAAGLALAGSAAADYSLNSTTATTTASITARTLNVTATAANKVYDATTSANINLSDNRIPGDQLTFTSTSSFTDKNVGNGKTVNITGIAISGGADQGNYSLSSSSTTATANITPASLTVTASGVSKVYDGTKTATVGLSDNHIGSDVVTDNFANANFPDKNVGSGRVVSVNGISITGTDAGNYSLTSTTATTSANITQRPLTITAATDTKTYDGTTTAATAPNLTGALAAGDSGTFTETYATKTAGTSKTLIPAAAINDGNGGNNYTVTPVNANVGTISPLAIVGSITASNKVYDTTTTASITCAPTGVIFPDVVTCTATSANFSDKNVGNGKTVTAMGVSLSGADAGNYSASLTSSTTANITPASLTVSAAGINKVYDGSNAATVTLTDNHLGNDVVSDNLGSASFFDKNVGNAKQVSVAGISISGADAGNYSLTSTTATTSANITQRPLTITAAANTKTYDGATTAAATPNLTGSLAAGDSGSFSESYATKTAGTNKSVIPAAVINDGNAGNNYAVTPVSANVGTITPLAIVGSISATSKVYDTTTTATITCAPVGVISPDVVTCAATSANFSDKNVGNGKTVTAQGVSLSGPDAGNYTASLTSTTTANITPASLTVSAGGIDKVYDGTNVATVTLADNHLGTDIVTDKAGSATFSDKNVGTVKQVSVGGISISGADAGNYTLANVTTTTNANITPRALLVSATGSNKVYDASTTATVTLSDNRVTGDSLADSFATAAFASANVGTGIAVSVTGISISGTDANNYTANTSAATTAAIAPASTTTSVTAPAGGTNQAEFTFNATVAPQIAGTPTGTVTFMDNGTPLGTGASGSSTVPLTNGTASFTLLVNQLGAGQHKITAVYNKDANFAAATTQVAAGVTVASNLSVSPGAPIAAQTITLSNPTSQSASYSNLKCSVLSSLGAAVANTLCSVSPASVTVAANGTASLSVQLATNVSAAQPAPTQARMRALDTLWLALPAVVFLPLAAPASVRRRLLRRKVMTILGLSLLLTFLLFSVGCGGNGFANPIPLQPGSGTSTTTQPGTYVVQISGMGVNGQTNLASIPMTVGF